MDIDDFHPHAELDDGIQFTEDEVDKNKITENPHATADGLVPDTVRNEQKKENTASKTALSGTSKELPETQAKLKHLSDQVTQSTVEEQNVACDTLAMRFNIDMRLRSSNCHDCMDQRAETHEGIHSINPVDHEESLCVIDVHIQYPLQAQTHSGVEFELKPEFKPSPQRTDIRQMVNTVKHRMEISTKFVIEGSATYVQELLAQAHVWVKVKFQDKDAKLHEISGDLSLRQARKDKNRLECSLLEEPGPGLLQGEYGLTAILRVRMVYPDQAKALERLTIENRKIKKQLETVEEELEAEKCENWGDIIKAIEEGPFNLDDLTDENSIMFGGSQISELLPFASPPDQGNAAGRNDQFSSRGNASLPGERVEIVEKIPVGAANDPGKAENDSRHKQIGMEHDGRPKDSFSVAKSFVQPENHSNEMCGRNDCPVSTNQPISETAELPKANKTTRATSPQLDVKKIKLRNDALVNNMPCLSSHKVPHIAPYNEPKVQRSSSEVKVFPPSENPKLKISQLPVSTDCREILSEDASKADGTVLEKQVYEALQSSETPVPMSLDVNMESVQVTGNISDSEESVHLVPNDNFSCYETCDTAKYSVPCQANMLDVMSIKRENRRSRKPIKLKCTQPSRSPSKDVESACTIPINAVNGTASAQCAALQKCSSVEDKFQCIISVQTQCPAMQTQGPTFKLQPRFEQTFGQNMATHMRNAAEDSRISSATFIIQGTAKYIEEFLTQASVRVTVTHQQTDKTNVEEVFLVELHRAKQSPLEIVNDFEHFPNLVTGTLTLPMIELRGPAVESVPFLLTNDNHEIGNESKSVGAGVFGHRDRRSIGQGGGHQSIRRCYPRASKRKQTTQATEALTYPQSAKTAKLVETSKPISNEENGRNQNFNNGPSLSRHGGESSEEKLYKCPEQGCTESFNNKSSLSRHRKKAHFPDRLHKCNLCGHAFPRPYMLQRHLDHNVCLPKEMKPQNRPGQC